MSKLNIVLYSASPRRKELLEGIGLKFRVESGSGDESFPENLTPKEIARHISEQKALSYDKPLEKEDVILTADTIVVLDGKIFGKPTSREEAIEMLQALSGRKHSVITAFTIRTINEVKTFDVETIVKFKHLDIDEIVYYIDNFKPYDKAGAYGIQEWIGYIGIEKIEGSFYNVMGLPVKRVYEELSGLEIRG
ncbi:MAG: Maf family nucleotide pyrophosphatase [Rikenellaceae bacterium]